MNTLQDYLQKLATPSILFDAETFVIKIADSPKEREDAFKLRFDVFNLEQGKGLDDSHEIGLDSDDFDDICLHLIVIYKPENRVVGTYRVLPGPVAINSEKGFYSQTEFDIYGIEHIAPKMMEIGRSCVHPDFRSGAVVSLLWSGLAELLRRGDLSCMLGCVSMEVTDSAGAWALYEIFKQNNRISTKLDSNPKPGFELARPDEADIQRILNDKAELNRIYPPLLKGYYRLGAHACGIPLWDPAFKTIDFLVLLDIANMPPKYYQHFIEKNG